MCSTASQSHETYQIDPSVPASSPSIEQVSLQSRSIENHQEASRPVSETPSNIPKEATGQVPALNGDVNAATNTDRREDQAENVLPDPMSETKDDSPRNEPTDQALEDALQEAVRAEADSHARGSDEMDMEVLYAPNPAQLAPEIRTEPIEEHNRSPEYSPALNRTAAPEITDRESDGYEPPDATAPTEAPDSPPFSPAPPESIHEAADVSMPDINSTQALDEDEPNIIETTQPLFDGTPQVLLEVNGFHIISTAPALLTTSRMLPRRIQTKFSFSLLTKVP
jgi:hypothetical protein